MAVSAFQVIAELPGVSYRLFRADLQYENYLSSPFYRTGKMLKYNHNEGADAPVYIFYLPFKRRSAKYRLPTKIYSPLRRIRTLKADGLTTHRERSLSVHCLHSSVLFFLIFSAQSILLFNFPYRTLRYGKRKIRCLLNSSGRRFR